MASGCRLVYYTNDHRPFPQLYSALPGVVARERQPHPVPLSGRPLSVPSSSPAPNAQPAAARRRRRARPSSGVDHLPSQAVPVHPKSGRRPPITPRLPTVGTSVTLLPALSVSHVHPMVFAMARIALIAPSARMRRTLTSALHPYRAAAASPPLRSSRSLLFSATNCDAQSWRESPLSRPFCPSSPQFGPFFPAQDAFAPPARPARDPFEYPAQTCTRGSPTATRESRADAARRRANAAAAARFALLPPKNALFRDLARPCASPCPPRNPLPRAAHSASRAQQDGPALRPTRDRLRRNATGRPRRAYLNVRPGHVPSAEAARHERIERL